jgi:hypothetical protein
MSNNTRLGQKGYKNPFDEASTIADPTLKSMYIGIAERKVAGDLLDLYGSEAARNGFGVGTTKEAQLQFVSNYMEFHLAAIGTLLPDLDCILKTVATGKANAEMVMMVNLLFPYYTFFTEVQQRKLLPAATIQLGKEGKTNKTNFITNVTKGNNQKGGMLRQRFPAATPATQIQASSAAAVASAEGTGAVKVAQIKSNAAVKQAQIKASTETTTTALFSGMKLLLVILMVAGLTGLLSFAASVGGEVLEGVSLSADLRAKRMCNGLDSLATSVTSGFGLWGTNEYKRSTMPRLLAEELHNWDLSRGTMNMLSVDSRLPDLKNTADQYDSLVRSVGERETTMNFLFTSAISDLNAGPVLPAIPRDLAAAEAEAIRLYSLTSGTFTSEQQPGANARYKGQQQAVKDLRVLKTMANTTKPMANKTSPPLNTNILTVIPAPQRARLSGDAQTYLSQIPVAEVSQRVKGLTERTSKVVNNPKAYLNFTDTTIDASPLWKFLVQEKGQFLENITTSEGQLYASAVYYSYALPCVSAMKEHVLRGRNTANALVETDTVKELTKKTPTSWDLLKRWVDAQVRSCENNQGLIECIGWQDKDRVARLQEAIVFGARHTDLEAPPPLALERVLGTIIIDNIPSMDRYDYDLYLYELLQRRNPDPMKRLYYACIASGALAALLLVGYKLISIPVNLLQGLYETSLLPALQVSILRKNLEAQNTLADGAIAQAEAAVAAGRVPVPGLTNGPVPSTTQDLVAASLDQRQINPADFLGAIDPFTVNPSRLGGAPRYVEDAVGTQEDATALALARQQGQTQSQLMGLMQLQLMQQMMASLVPPRPHVPSPVQIPAGWAMGADGQLHPIVQQQQQQQQALANAPRGNSRFPPTAFRQMVQGLEPQQQLANGPRGTGGLPALTNGPAAPPAAASNGSAVQGGARHRRRTSKTSKKRRVQTKKKQTRRR